MKIIGGQFKGRNFYRPEGIRPTQNVVRKALFDIIGHDLTGVSFADLFAGSGAVGLEALSEGAADVLLVEKEARCAETIRENIGILGVDSTEAGFQGAGHVTLLHSDAFAAVKTLSRQEKRFDIVFADPPFGRELAKKTLKTLGAYDIVHPNSSIIIQSGKREILPEEHGRFRLFRQKKYGASLLFFYRPVPQALGVNEESAFQ